MIPIHPQALGYRFVATHKPPRITFPVGIPARRSQAENWFFERHWPLLESCLAQSSTMPERYHSRLDRHAYRQLFHGNGYSGKPRTLPNLLSGVHGLHENPSPVLWLVGWVIHLKADGYGIFGQSMKIPSADPYRSSLALQIFINGNCSLTPGNHRGHHQVWSCDTITASKYTLAGRCTRFVVGNDQTILLGLQIWCGFANNRIWPLPEC